MARNTPPLPPSTLGSPKHSAVRLPVLLLALAALLLAVPASAYIVVLKDGTQITTAKKYERQGENVILTLPSGTQTSYPASDIDFTKTDSLNEGTNFGQARLLTEDGKTQRIDQNVPTDDGETSLAELVSGRSGGGLALPQQQRRPNEAEQAVELPKTTAGFVDFMALPRMVHEDDAMSSEIIRYLRSQGNDSARVYQGTAPDRPLVEITTTSEASVFKALRDVANCLVQSEDSLAGIELLLLTGGEAGKAGQFSMDRQQASDLASGKIEPPQFFLNYVEF